MPQKRKRGPAAEAHGEVAATEHERLADLLARSEQLHRSMFDRSPLPMWMFDRETLRIVAVNEAAIRRYGYSHEEFLELTLEDLRRPVDDRLECHERALERLFETQSLFEAAAQLGRLPLLGRRVRSLCAATLGSLVEPLTMFVNLHPEDLDDADLVDAAAPLTAVARRVVLEVTERASLEITESLTRRLARLRELGFRLAVDDIGAGYSGLRSFTDLQPELVKIDMTLVRNVDQSALKQRTIAAICSLCHDIGCAVVGEGVETQDERQTLVTLGCDLIQGYLIGRPSPQLPR